MRVGTFLKIVLVVILAANAVVADTTIDDYEVDSVVIDLLNVAPRWDGDGYVGIVVNYDRDTWISNGIDLVFTGSGGPNYNIGNINIADVSVLVSSDVTAIAIATSLGDYTIGDLRITCTDAVAPGEVRDLYGLYRVGEMIDWEWDSFKGNITGGSIYAEDTGSASRVYGAYFHGGIEGNVEFGTITVRAHHLTYDTAYGFYLRSSSDDTLPAIHAAGSLTLGDIYADGSWSPSGGACGIALSGPVLGELTTGTIDAIGNSATGISLYGNFAPNEHSKIGDIFATAINGNATGIDINADYEITLPHGINIRATADSIDRYSWATGINGGKITLVDGTIIRATDLSIGGAEGIYCDELTISGTVDVRATAHEGVAYGIVGHRWDNNLKITTMEDANLTSIGSNSGLVHSFGIMGWQDSTIILGKNSRINSTGADYGIYAMKDLVLDLESGSTLTSTGTGNGVAGRGFGIDANGSVTIKLGEKSNVISNGMIVRGELLSVSGPGVADVGVLALPGYDGGYFNNWTWVPLINDPGDLIVQDRATLAFDIAISESVLGTGSKTFQTGGKLGVYSTVEHLQNNKYQFHFERDEGNYDTGDWFFLEGYRNGIDWDYDPIYEWDIGYGGPGRTDPFLYVKKLRGSADGLVDDGFLVAAGMHRRYAAWRAVQPHLISGEGTCSLANPFDWSAYRGQVKNKTLFGCPVFPQNAWVQYTNRNDVYRSSYNDKDWKLSADGVQVGVDLYTSNRTRPAANFCDDPCPRIVCGTQFGMLFGYECGRTRNKVSHTVPGMPEIIPVIVPPPIFPNRPLEPQMFPLEPLGDEGDDDDDDVIARRTGFDRVKMDDYYFGFYGAHVFRNDFDIRGSFAGGFQTYNMVRNTSDSRYTAKFRGYTTETNLELGKRLGTGLWSVRPVIGFDVMTNALQSAKETGGTLPLTYAKTNLTQIFVRPGVELRFQEEGVTVGGGVFYAYEMSGNALGTRISTNGVDWVPLDGPQLGRNLVMFNLGCMYQVSPHFALFAGYQGEYVADREHKTVQNAGYGGGMYQW